MPVFVWRLAGPSSPGVRQASAEGFFDEAIGYFSSFARPGIERPAASQNANVKRLALLELIAASPPSLLILDGLEAIQEAHDRPGKSRIREDEAVLVEFLSELDKANPEGLCVVTTREPPVDFDHYQGEGKVEFLELKGLAAEDGEKILRGEEVEGDSAEFRDAVRHCNGHPLFLRLLGIVLRQSHQGKIEYWRHVVERPDFQRDRIDPVHRSRRGEGTGNNEHDRVQPANPIERIIAYYEERLSNAERAVLRLQGFFRGPASHSALAALLRSGPESSPGVARKIAPFCSISDAELESALDTFCQARIFDRHARTDGESYESQSFLRLYCATENEAAYEAHALMRDYYARLICNEFPDAWREGHERLYRHLTALDENQDSRAIPSRAILRNLEAAVHGCRAGLLRDVAENIYWLKLARKEPSFRLRPAGDYFPKFLDALAQFFDPTWTRIAHACCSEQELTRPLEALIKQDTGHYLFLTGRLEEAVRLLEESVKIREVLVAELSGPERIDNLQHLSKHCRILREIELIRGNIDQAAAWSESSVEYAALLPRESDLAWGVETAAQAQVFHYQNRLEEAHAAFCAADASFLPICGRPMNSFGWHWFSEFLLDRIEARIDRPEFFPPDAGGVISELEEILERTVQMLATLPPERHIEQALGDLAQGRALAMRGGLQHRYGDHGQSRADFAQAELHFGRAAEELRAAGQRHYLVIGLLTWGDGLRRMGALDRAIATLTEARRIAHQHGMKLFDAEASWGLARCYGDMLRESAADDSDLRRTARECLNRAGRLLNPTGAAKLEAIGYQRRVAAMGELDRELGGWTYAGQNDYHTSAFCCRDPENTGRKVQPVAGDHKPICGVCAQLAPPQATAPR
jgi:hypothetical protein